jgi:dipeptidyl aminopeptidase/acylaminoacyl peptidase
VAERDLTYPAGPASVEGTLYLPDRQVGEMSGGVVLCPGRQRDYRSLAFLARALTDRGYAVLATRYRSDSLDADSEDAQAAIDCLIKEARAPAARVGVVGHSRGGMTALLTAAADSRVATCVAISPITDRVRYLEGAKVYAPSRYQDALTFLGSGSMERQRALSAIGMASRIRIPVLFIHGGLDLVVPSDQSVWMHEALQAAGNQKSRLRILPWLGHFFEDRYYGYRFDEVAAVTVEWIETTLR